MAVLNPTLGVDWTPEIRPSPAGHRLPPAAQSVISPYIRQAPTPRQNQDAGREMKARARRRFNP